MYNKIKPVIDVDVIGYGENLKKDDAKYRIHVHITSNIVPYVLGLYGTT